MDIGEFQLLLSPEGQGALQAAAEFSPREADYLQHYQVLCRQYAPELARAALETAILRIEGERKFPFAKRMYFTRAALEQASNWEVSSYRARRYQGQERVIDLGCSIGGDTMALAEIASTTGIDIDPLRLAMAKANLAVGDQSYKTKFLLADLQSTLPLPHRTSSSGTALFFDPARRMKHRRVYSVHDYTPPLDIINTWLPYFPALGVKISPGVKLRELAKYDAEIEFISLRGGLKEAVLWFGPLKTTRRRATILPGERSLTSDLREDELHRLKLPLSQPLAYIYEPDPSVLRAGLVYQLGEQLGACQLDPDIAYLTAAELVSTPFARSWKIEAWFPFGLKRLRTYLREQSVGQVTVKKRGSPIQPEDLICDLRLKGGEERVIFLTHLRGRPIVVICYANTISN